MLEFQKLVAMPKAKRQVVNLLTSGLCLSQGSCSGVDVGGEQQLSLQVLQDGAEAVEEALTPNWWTVLYEIWMKIHPIGQLGGTFTFCAMCHGILKWIYRLVKRRWWNQMTSCMLPRREMYPHLYNEAPAYEETPADTVQYELNHMRNKSRTTTTSTMA